MKKIIIDTDLLSDCDDAGAIALANVCKNKKIADVLCITHCLKNKKALECVQLINEFYGNDIPLGIASADPWDYSAALEIFVNKVAPSGAEIKFEYPNAVDLILKTLYGEKGVTLCFIGQLNNFAELLNLKEQTYRGKKIADILTESVDEVVIMGGNFSLPREGRSAEFNIEKSLEAAKTVCEKNTLPTVFSDGKQGCDIFTGQTLANNPNNPAYKIYREFRKHFFGDDKCERQSWDPVALYYAVFGAEKNFSLSAKGTVSVDDRAITDFTPDFGGNARLLSVTDKTGLQREINELLA